MVNIYRKTLYILVVFSYLSCARMASPSGGVKDTTPPVPLRSKPVNYSTNFKDDKIIIEFDEFIVLKNINQELLISPPLENRPEIKQRGKNLILKINNELKDSTTYNINFYNSIVDLNEGNVLNNFQFEFSTNSGFDSLYMLGKVYDAFNYSTEGDIYVMLYDAFNDSIPRKVLPNYISKTNKDGEFIIPNINKKPYYIFALKDMNNNMLFDLPNEKIAFLDSAISTDFKEIEIVDTVQVIKSISIDSNDTLMVDSIITHKDISTTVGNIKLDMFVEEYHNQYLRQVIRPERELVIFAFNEILKDSIYIKPLGSDGEDWFIKEKFKINDSLVYWITDSLLYNNDSLEFQINYTKKDSSFNNYTQTDTLFAIFTPKENLDKSKRKEKKSRLNLNFLDKKKKDTKKDSVRIPSKLKITHNAKTPFELNEDVEMSVNYPIKTIDTDRIKLYMIENDTVKTPVKFLLKKDSLNFRKYKIIFEKDEEESFELLIPEHTITDIYNNTNDTLICKFKTRPFDYYSILYLDIKNVKDNSVVQLLGGKQNVVLKEINILSDTTVAFDYLKPAKYFVKLFYDSNKNKKWDTGNFKELKQPEKVFYYPFMPEALDIKSNSEISNTWILKDK